MNDPRTRDADDDHFVLIDIVTGVETPVTWPVDNIPGWQRLAP
jgi:hypothetical protein